MRINIKRDYLRAARVLAANQDIRYYLNGVHVIASSGETRLVATDGSLAGCLSYPCENQVEGVITLTIPRAKVELVTAKDPNLLYVHDNGTGDWSLCIGNDAYPFTPVEGTFPDYLRVIPSSVSGEPGDYSADLIARFKKVAVLLGQKNESPIIYQNGPKAPGVVGIRVEPLFIGVISPYNHNTEKEPKPPIPSFAHHPLLESFV
jgi:DNA polymerase-3 subunit beta